ncbi:MAG: protein translocase subunit SecDF, partial [Bacteroidia bacterium]
MKNQGVVKIFTIALALVCLFHLSFTIKSRLIASAAEEYANGDPVIKQKYLDSISGTVVYDLGLRQYTYLQVKERELNLGLDLQGGMNVTLEVSLPDVIHALANKTKDPKFTEALALANTKARSSQADYVTLFVDAIHQTAPNTPLSTWFATKDNKEKVSFNTSDADVVAFLKLEADEAVERTFRIIRSRIDRFGVSQPVIQKLENSGRIMVELPGVSDPQRARDLIQKSAILQFWNTYSPAQAIEFIDKMDKTLKARLDGEKGIAAADTTDVDSLNIPKDTSAQQDTTKKDDLLAALNQANDSSKQDTGAQSFEQFKEDRPLFATIGNGTTSFFNMTSDGQFGGGAELAFVSVFDTASISVYLNDVELREVIPGDVVFAWGNKADDGNRIPLYVLKAGRDGGAEMEGDVITDARSVIGPSGGFEVSMQMNQEGKLIWKRMTGEAANMEPNGFVA